MCREEDHPPLCREEDHPPREVHHRWVTGRGTPPLCTAGRTPPLCTAGKTPERYTSRRDTREVHQQEGHQERINDSFNTVLRLILNSSELLSIPRAAGVGG